MHVKRPGPVLVALALFATACASVPTPQARPGKPSAAKPPAAAAVKQRAAALDAEEFRKALEESYETIVARSTTPAPIVDADASLSMPMPDHRTIQGAVSYFSTDLQASIQDSLYRSSRYKSMIVKVLDEYRLPRGLAYLPVIESAYIPTLTSRAGARGMWQFMPPTAREYGMRVDWWVDERCDPEISTRAAARFLRDLYREFGDWSLVLAAYNAGPGRVRRALAESNSTTFWDLLEKTAVPRETRGYVPTFYATLHIVSDPATYGFALVEDEEAELDQLAVDGPVTLAYVATAAGVDEAELEDLNPAFRRGLLPPGRTAIRMPKGTASRIADRAARLRDEDPSLPVAMMTVRKGDSLERIAKRLKVPVTDLLSMNGRKKNDLRPGDSIYLPVRQEEVSALRQPVDRYYSVRKGDTLFAIARAHGLTVDELRDLNDLTKNHVLHPGDRLRISLGTATLAGGGS